MNEDQIRAFLAVLEWGSFSAASKHLNLSQPAVSQRIKSLESELNTTLFERAPGRSAPLVTEAGQLLEAEARVTLARWGQLREEIRARGQLERGSVTIGGGATAVSFILPRVIAQVLATYPELNIRVRESGSAEVIKRVLNAELDLGIITDQGAPLDPRLDSTHLIEDRIVAVVDPRHPLASRCGGVESSELSGERLVAYESSSAIGELITSALQKHQVEARVWTELRSIHSILEIARLTLSVALVSELSEPLWSEMVRLKSPLEGDLKRGLHLIWSRERAETHSSSCFKRILIDMSAS